MSPYTVVLLRPEEVADDSARPDSYTALVKAEDLPSAVQLAREEAFRADKRDGLFVEGMRAKPGDYLLVVAFNGHHYPVGYGWQAGYE
jgi:hypothetical protein